MRVPLSSSLAAEHLLRDAYHLALFPCITCLLSRAEAQREMTWKDMKYGFGFHVVFSDTEATGSGVKGMGTNEKQLGFYLRLIRLFQAVLRRFGRVKETWLYRTLGQSVLGLNAFYIIEFIFSMLTRSPMLRPELC